MDEKNLNNLEENENIEIIEEESFDISREEGDNSFSNHIVIGS